ncbi:hypothetical protein WJX79_003822 [Trebouxia sp. C0005]
MVLTVPTPSPVAVHDENRVWTLHDLATLHELQKPAAVVVSAVYESPHSPLGTKDSVRVIFANEQLTKQYGAPRPQEECAHLMRLTSEEAQRKRRNWLSKAAMGKHGHQTWMDVRQLLMPVFSGVTLDGPSRMLRVDSKPIKVETSPGHVEIAFLHVIESEGSSHTDLRVAAIYDRSPIHTFMFDSEGAMLTANQAALLAHQRSALGLTASHGSAITLRSLFDCGSYDGGQQEAQAAYDEAVNAVFSLQVDCHRHIHPHISKKDGRTKWAMIEMWPMQDPVTAGSAVLAKKYNISQQKELELQLASQQVALQRQNQELEQDSVIMQEEQRKLQREANSLAQRLEAVLHDKFTPRSGFDADTPIDKTLQFLQGVIAGDMPPVQTALDLYHILSESDTNLRQPVGLESQLLQHSLGSEVGQSMLQLLQGNSSAPRGGEGLIISGPVCMLSDKRACLESAAAQSSGLARHGSMTKQQQQQLFIPTNVTPDVERRLYDAESNWQFDIFGYAEACHGKCLSMLTFHLMKQTGIIKEHGLDESKLCHFLQKIESGYDSANPYHNSVHVASVVQMSHMLLCHGGVLKSGAMNRQQQVATYWSAMVHDHEHGGLNNDFLIKSRHPLAITYNDQSPLENHHLASAVRLLLQPEYQYIPASHCSAEATAQFRIVAVNQVLGTDMKKHFDITSRFQAAFKKASGGAEATSAAATIDWDQVKVEDKTLVEQMVMKCADIGHLAAAARTHKRWAYQLEEEFFRQGDKERSCGLSVSPLMDRSTQGGMTRSQMGFFSIVGIPLFKAMAEVFEDAQPMLDGVMANYHHWEAATPEADLPA